MTEDSARELISNLSWVFAKTYADKSPHEYTVVKTDHDHRKEAVEFMKFILANGETELYFGHPFTVYKLDGRKYWSMAKSKEEISDDNYILNRSLLHNVDTIYK